MTEGNLNFTLHNESARDLCDFLYDYAEIMKILRQDEEAERAETIMFTLYRQHASKL